MPSRVFGSLREDQGQFCSQYAGQQAECVHLNECSVRPVFHVLTGYFDSVLAHLTLADLARTEAESKARIERFARLEAERVRTRFAPPPASAKQGVTMGSQE